MTPSNPPRFRPIDIFSVGERRRGLGARHCEAVVKGASCDQATREGKRYCSDHVDQHPYAANLIERLEAVEEEDKIAEKHPDDRRRRPNINGITAQEILSHISVMGPRTVERLARELNKTLKVIQGYCDYMVKKRLVRYSITKRGSTLVHLREEGK